MSFADMVALQLDLSEDRLEAYIEERQVQELLLGIHFLNLPMEKLHRVTRLPSTLQRLELDFARIALLFVLGHERALREEDGFSEIGEDEEAVQTFFELWQEKTIAEDIPLQPTLVDGETSTLKSTILGSEVVIEMPNNEASFGVAESILSTMEAFLSTCDDREAFPYRESVAITVTPSAKLQGSPQIVFPDTDSSPIEVTHPVEMSFTTVEERQAFLEWLEESLLQIACRMLMIQDAEAWVEQVINQERGFSRALKFGDNLTLNRSVLGRAPKIRLEDWLEQDDQNYEVLRDKPWRTGKTTKESNSMESVQFSSDSPPANLLDRERLKHTEQRVLTPIDTRLWNRAQWRGTVFEWSPDPGNPPILAIGFEDEEAGQEIFRAWRDRWGSTDENDFIRVAIITGLSEQRPAEYAVAIGPNLRHVVKDGQKAFWLLSRINRMSASSSTNLSNFVKAYRAAGIFFLAPVLLSSSRNIVGAPSRQFAIAKRHLDIREAWQIGENDPDTSVLNEDDEPIIPEGVTDPPVDRALTRIRTRRER